MHICEIFRSLQGEGKDIGCPTVFLRTRGCNLRCSWCDTSYAWEMEGEEVSPEYIYGKIGEYSTDRLCITGGEPLLQKDLYQLLDGIQGYRVSVETNGSLDISKLAERNLMISMDYKTPSSGMEDRMLNANLGKLRSCDQLKFVIAHGADYFFATKILGSNEVLAEVIFQPVWGVDISTLADKVLDDELDVRVLPQLHKYIWGDLKGF